MERSGPREVHRKRLSYSVLVMYSCDQFCMYLQVLHLATPALMCIEACHLLETPLVFELQLIYK